MKQLNFNNQRNNLSKDDIDSILNLITYKCRIKTVTLLRSILTYSPSSIPQYGILERLMKDDGKWHYVAGQSYADEIRTVRELILNGKV
jgi:hypothetical protein